jgi:hypothetical protein
VLVILYCKVDNDNDILLSAIGLSSGGSGHLTHIQNMRLVCYYS